MVFKHLCVCDSQLMKTSTVSCYPQYLLLCFEFADGNDVIGGNEG